MIENFKPNLFPNEQTDLSIVKYPVLASTKLDGIRCVFKDGRMLSRSLKPIPNKQLQKRFQHLKEYSEKNKIILDGEIYGHNLTFQQITHFVMTEDLGNETLPENLQYFCFDALKDTIQNFEDRIKLIPDEKYLFKVGQKLVHNKNEVEDMFDEALEGNYEGLILKNPKSKYKFGRTTYNSGDGYKVKPFLTFDSQIINVEERMENTGESYTNELGRSQKHSYLGDQRPTGIAGCFVVNYENQEQKVNIGRDESFRREIWRNKNSYIGKWIEFKGMLVGSKDKVRHPVFVRFREDRK